MFSCPLVCNKVEKSTTKKFWFLVSGYPTNRTHVQLNFLYWVGFLVTLGFHFYQFSMHKLLKICFYTCKCYENEKTREIYLNFDVFSEYMNFTYACRNSLLVFLLLEEPLNHARSNIYLSRYFLETFFKRFEAEMNIVNCHFY